jgi:cytoskeletal protein CcmA (bactofilin family)
MLNFHRRDRGVDGKEGDKTVLKPALYDPPGSTPRPPAGAAPRAAPTPTAMIRDGTLAPPPAAAPEVAALKPVPGVDRLEGSHLSVGVNIKLKGVEISDCDVLRIEGQVDATVHSKVMEIAKPGTLKGTAEIDIAEIHGEFEGELHARTRLVVHATGRVSGTIRYGKLVVAEGGELSGDVQRIAATSEHTH